jgi:formate-dependent nitrite reductase membrane component NrfD
MTEELLTTLRANVKVDPVLSIWSWEIPLYLYLGGLTAGLMIFAALAVLMRREREAPFAGQRAILWAPVILSVGMLFLFLDLEHKLYVYRFYTAFQPTSPMSWGSWFLVLVYPASIALLLARFRQGYPALAGRLEWIPGGEALLDLAERQARPIAAANLVAGVCLGIYTGILLSAFSARPFWNSGLLGPIFLVSGLSTAAALIVLAAREHGERGLFSRIDVGLIVAELTLVLLLLINLTTGSQPQLEAARHLLGGDYTLVFWGVFVLLGLLIPLGLEVLELRGVAVWAALAPVLVLMGGYALRQITVDLGQETTWVQYEQPYDPALLRRLEIVGRGE